MYEVYWKSKRHKEEQTAKFPTREDAQTAIDAINAWNAKMHGYAPTKYGIRNIDEKPRHKPRKTYKKGLHAPDGALRDTWK